MNDIHFISSELMNALAMTMLHSLWQGALIVLVIGLVFKVLHNLKAQQQYFVFLSGLVVLFLAAVFTFILHLNSNVYEFSPFLKQGVSFGGPFTMEGANNTFVFSWQKALALVWCLGAFFLLARALMGTFQIWKIRKNAFKADMEWQWLISDLQKKLEIDQKVRILVSDDCLIPFVWGVFKSVIVVPSMYFTQLSQQEIESILLHELTHIRRHDFLVNLAQVLIESLLFFNPATWWLSNQLKRQREFCCDDTVQQQMTNQSVYLKALYKVALFSINQRPDYSVALFNQNPELIMRMKRMLNTPVRQTGNQTIFTMSIGVLVVGLMFTLNVAFAQQSEATEDEVTTNVESQHVVNPVEQKMVFTSVVAPKVEISSITEMQVAVSPVVTSVEVDVASPVVRIHPVVKNHVAPGMHLSMNTGYQFAHDTLPTSPKLEELERRMEVKAEEMERLAERMEHIMEESIDPDIEQIERLADQLEEMQEDKIDEFRELHDSDVLDRLEELSQEMETLMDDWSDEMEDSFPEEMVESISEEIEKTAEQYESDQPLTEEERKRLDAKMKSLQEKLQAVMNEREVKMKNNPPHAEMQRIQNEMEEVQKQLEPVQKMYELHKEIWSEDAKAIQKEMHQLQIKMEQKMQVSTNEIQYQMEQKSNEMQELAREMEIEYNRLKKQKGEE